MSGSGDVPPDPVLVETIAARLARIRERIASACPADRDPSEITIVAASKYQPAAVVRAAFAAGVRDFGENYAQELSSKRAVLLDLAEPSRASDAVALRWHFIGALQSNKARLVADCRLVHGVDRLSVMQALDKAAATSERVVEVLIEVHGGEVSKSGVAPEALGSLLDAAALTPHVRVVGLMGIAPLAQQPERAAEVSGLFFRSLRALRDREARVARKGVELRHLSMGMSDDLELAVAAGSTIVRVGTALLGPRLAA